MSTSLRVVFGAIASFAIINNGLLLAVIFKNRSLLRMPYNTLVLSLAINDLITGRCSISLYPTLIEKLMTRSRTAFMVLPSNENVVSVLNNIDSYFHY